MHGSPGLRTTGETRANTGSPYYAGLADVLTRAFGVPAVLAEALRPVAGIHKTYLYGSWAACHAGEPGRRLLGECWNLDAHSASEVRSPRTAAGRKACRVSR